jgi:hypothetical protein
MNLLDAANQYGVLQSLVSTAGSIVAAGGAITLAFRKRAKWEPSEEDIKRGPEKVGGLVGAILIAILYFETKSSSKSSSDHHHLLINLALAGIIVCVVALLAYGFLTSMQTYNQVCAVDGVVSNRKIIGGFMLTAQAKKNMRNAGVPTIQQFFEGSAYEVDLLWSRPSRSSAKLLFVICYLALTISGTVALASAAILLGSH